MVFILKRTNGNGHTILSGVGICFWNQTWWSPHTSCSCITKSSQVQELLPSQGEPEMEDMLQSAFRHSGHGLDQSTTPPSRLICNPWECSILTTRHFASQSSNTEFLSIMDIIHEAPTPTSHHLPESYLAFRELISDKLMAALLILPTTSHCEDWKQNNPEAE